MPFLSKSYFKNLVILGAVLFVSACTRVTQAPVIDNTSLAPVLPKDLLKQQQTALSPTPCGPDCYVVQLGDTLSAIARRANTHVEALVRLNNLADRGYLRVGQKLRLPQSTTETTTLAQDTSPKFQPTHTAASVPLVTVENPKAFSVPYSQQAYQQLQQNIYDSSGAKVSPSEPPPTQSPLVSAALQPPPSSVSATVPNNTTKPATQSSGWQWPLSGKVIRSFGTDSNKGIDIAAPTGTPVHAAAAGQVVFASQNIRGYGKLVIIKHSRHMLSAYAHNSLLLVKEGQQVSAGQEIARVGSTQTNVSKLHFEVRRQGKPIDPLSVLPQ